MYFFLIRIHNSTPQQNGCNKATFIFSHEWFKHKSKHSLFHILWAFAEHHQSQNWRRDIPGTLWLDLCMCKIPAVLLLPNPWELSVVACWWWQLSSSILEYGDMWFVWHWDTFETKHQVNKTNWMTKCLMQHHPLEWQRPSKWSC